MQSLNGDIIIELLFDILDPNSADLSTGSIYFLPISDSWKGNLTIDNLVLQFCDDKFCKRLHCRFSISAIDVPYIFFFNSGYLRNIFYCVITFVLIFQAGVHCPAY